MVVNPIATLIWHGLQHVQHVTALRQHGLQPMRYVALKAKSRYSLDAPLL
jgi:hypothetical protein